MSKLLDIMTAPWAITTDMLQEIGGIYLTHLRGEKIDINAVEARIGHPLQNEKAEVQIIDNVAVITAHGVVAKRANMFMQISGGVSTEILADQIQAALDNPSVKALILDIDSPGGTVDGTFELADGLFNSRGDKPIVALANGLMASAAYAFGAATDAIYMTGPTTHVGSIGVVAAHTDYSRYEEKLGIKTTEIYAGKYKRIASQHEPLTADGKESIQASVDYLYSIFVERVATFRGVPVSTVLDGMADGKIFIGQQAIDAGLVDGISTLSDLIAELSMGRMPEKQTSAKTNVTGVVTDDEAEILPTQTEESEMKPEEITKGYVAENHPDIAEAFRNEGAEAARDEGATAERQRIQDVRSHSMPGHEALVEALAFDGKTTGPEAAVAVLQAEKKNKIAVTDNINDDAAALDVVDASADGGLGNEASLENLPLEDKCKAKWDQDPKLRAEFNDKFSTYLALEKGLAKGGKILGKTQKG